MYKLQNYEEKLIYLVEKAMQMYCSNTKIIKPFYKLNIVENGETLVRLIGENGFLIFEFSTRILELQEDNIITILYAEIGKYMLPFRLEKLEKVATSMIYNFTGKIPVNFPITVVNNQNASIELKKTRKGTFFKCSLNSFYLQDEEIIARFIYEFVYYMTDNSPELVQILGKKRWGAIIEKCSRVIQKYTMRTYFKWTPYFDEDIEYLDEMLEDSLIPDENMLAKMVIDYNGSNRYYMLVTYMNKIFN